MARFFENSNMVVSEDEQNSPGAADPGVSLSPESPHRDGGTGQSSTDKRQLDRGNADDAISPGGSPAPAVELAEAVQHLREGRMYDPVKTYGTVFRRNTFQDAAAGADPELVATVDREAAGIFADLRLSHSEAQTAFDVFKGDPPDDGTADSWRADSESYIESLGADGPAKLELARQLVRRDPRIAKLLDGAYGDHPDIVRLVIEKAAAEKRDGRL